MDVLSGLQEQYHLEHLIFGIGINIELKKYRRLAAVFKA